jgi:2-oxo-4-hydroxy-4-carboxy-5-ureidoimidazoline decarboxylase
MRFDFPFVIAVKGLGPDEIMSALERRLTNDVATERREAIAQIAKIAGFRLHELIPTTAPSGRTS